MSYFGDTWQGRGAIAAHARAPRSAPGINVGALGAVPKLASRARQTLVRKPTMGTNVHTIQVPINPPPNPNDPQMGPNQGNHHFPPPPHCPTNYVIDPITGVCVYVQPPPPPPPPPPLQQLPPPWYISQPPPDGGGAVFVNPGTGGGSATLYVCADGSKVSDPSACPVGPDTLLTPPPTMTTSSSFPWLLALGVGTATYLLLRKKKKP
jgi:hypothetical protein